MLPQEFLKKVREIEIVARRLAKEGMAGLYMSAFRGTGMQFKEFRNYVYGDDVRHISWNVSARTQEPVLKTFEEERERSLFLLVDVSASLREGPWAKRKAERLAEVAATFAMSAAQAKDKLGVLLYSDQIERVIPPAKGKTHLLRIIRDILLYTPRGTRTAPDLALKQLDQVLKKHSIVVMLSDHEVLPNEKILRQNSSQHEFLSIAIEDPQEYTLPAVGFFELQTAELGRPVTVDSSSPALQNYLLKYAETRRSSIENVFKKAGADLIWVSTEEDFVPKLQEHFRRRKRGLKSARGKP